MVSVDDLGRTVPGKGLFYRRGECKLNKSLQEACTYLCKFTSELTAEAWRDYESAYFSDGGGTQARRMHFSNLYLNNPYGDSIHAIVYLDGRPMATNGHLRSDLEDNCQSFMSLHTYVSPELRGVGIFGKISNMCLEMSSPHYVYGFPNDNSYHGFIKLGWKVREVGFASQYYGRSVPVLEAHSKFKAIPDDYVRWRFADNSSEYRVFSRNGLSLLLRKKQIRGLTLYQAVGLVSKESAPNFAEVNPFGIFSYVDGPRLVAIKRSTTTIIENTKYSTSSAAIPVWRSDVF